MRNQHYKVYGYRLADKTADEIKRLKRKLGTSYNLLFVDLIKNSNKKNKNNFNNKINKPTAEAPEENKVL